MKRIRVNVVEVIVYEHAMTDFIFLKFCKVKDLTKFKKVDDVILVNRITNDLQDVIAKLHNRNIFWNN